MVRPLRQPGNEAYGMVTTLTITACLLHADMCQARPHNDVLEERLPTQLHRCIKHIIGSYTVSRMDAVATPFDL
jgi:hypothetical protein